MSSSPEFDLSNAFKAREDIIRWRAERENASARLELAHIAERVYLVLSQHQPVAALGLDRNALRVIMDYVRTGSLPADLAAISPTLRRK